ncbi:MAG TPA: hypothetical protein VHM69_13260 [Rubrobacter sp.]|nr:hypothetical protein [Rubrobacter sp.]
MVGEVGAHGERYFAPAAAWAGAEENRVPQRFVFDGPYSYERNPLHVTDFASATNSPAIATHG